MSEQEAERETEQDSGAGEQQGNSGGQQQSQRTDLESLPADVKALIADLRKENATTRTKAKEQTQTAAQQAEQATLQRLAVALGLKDDDKPDPDKLAKDLESTRSKAREAQSQLAVIRGAAKVKGDHEALLDSVSTMTKINKLDPDDDDYAAEVERILGEAVKNNPRLGIGTTVGASGRDLSSGSGSANGQAVSRRDDEGKSEDEIRKSVLAARRGH